jgi:probable phosphoglycerate mutase
MPLRIYLIRHGETEWSLSGRHTGASDIPLTAAGEAQARALGERLKDVSFARVFASPRIRAQTTQRLVLPAAKAETAPDLAEWDYGAYEGKTTREIRIERPDWALFRDGAPGGESPADVSGRADRMLALARGLDGNVALFTHGHFSRVLAARWIGLPAIEGRRFLLDVARVGVLGCEHEDPGAPVLARWNAPS